MEQAMLRLIRHSIERDERQNRRCRLVHAVCMLQADDDAILTECRSMVRTWVLDESTRNNPLSRYASAWRLRHVIRSFRPDVVHARSTGAWFDATAATLAWSSARLLLSFHGRTHLRPLAWRRQCLNRWATRRSAAVLTVSRDAACMLQHEWNVLPQKLYTIPNGVDTQRFRPATDLNERRRIRQRLDLGPDHDVVICVANLMPIKGIDTLLQAWRQIDMADRPVCLLLVGDGPLRPSLVQLANQLCCRPAVRFLGHRNDVEQLLRAADLFVLPSRYEACSNVTLEAMASGLPVVACDVGGMRELITPDQTGWLVSPDSPQQLADTISAVLTDGPSRHRAGQAGRETVVRQFGIDSWTDQYAALYHVLSRRPQPQRANGMEGMVCAG
jgi:glycosyltransferase involved in cell wall biosynthesis